MFEASAPTIETAPFPSGWRVGGSYEGFPIDSELAGLLAEAERADRAGAAQRGRAGTTPPADGTGAVPEDLDTMPPGIMLAAALSEIDVHRLSAHDRVIVLRAHQRMASHHDAKRYEAMAAITDAYAAHPEAPADYADVCDDASAEIRVALRWTRRATDKELSFALDTRRRIPIVFERLAAGRIDVRRAKTFDHGTVDLPLEVARTIVDRLIDEASGLTPGELAAKIRRLRSEVEPDEARRRHDQAHDERSVVMEATPDGTANIHAFGLRADHATEFMNCLHRTARSLKRDGDDRTMDQLRADVFVDLPGIAASGDRTAARGTVDLHVDLDTLAGLRESSADLAGYGPVIADIARQLTDRLGTAVWTWTVDDPKSGMPVATGTTRRRPNAEQRRTVRSRDRRCIFPGCRMPATEADLDHTRPWAEGGATDTDNLAPLCRHDHCVRHRAGWTYTRRPDHDYVWRSPTGHRSTTSGRDP